MGVVGGLVHLLRRDSARAGRLELAQAPERSVRSSRWLVQWRSLGSRVDWTAEDLGPSRTKFPDQDPAIAATGSANQNKAAPGRFPSVSASWPRDCRACHLWPCFLRRWTGSNKSDA